MRKKLLLLTFIVTISTIFVGSVYNNGHTNPDGSPNSRTGSPGDGGNTCAVSGCHTGFAVGIKTGVLSSNIPSEGYTPGTKYTITVTARSSANRNTFGFQVSPQSTTGTLVGAMTVTSASTTKLTGGGKYLTHTISGTTGSGGVKTWTFDWTAPVLGTGDVTFYGAFNHANGNGGTSGDSIFKTTYVINEKFVQSVNNNALSVLGFSIYPNPANHSVYVKNDNGVVYNKIEVYDMNGKLVYSLNENEEAINLDLQFKLNLNNLESGLYLIKLSNNNEVLGSSKFIIK